MKDSVGPVAELKVIEKKLFCNSSENTFPLELLLKFIAGYATNESGMP